MSAPRIAVIGGGLAGIAAALDCADAGAEVTLLEVRRRLGGAAYSFERDGLHMDNGQHVFLRCCVAYRALLARLGSESLVRVQQRLDIPVLKPGAPPTRLRRSALPAPLHLAGALLRYPHLGVRERLAAGRAALALARVADGEATDSETFGEWLARHGQSETAVGALWDLIALPTLNVAAAQASLELAAFVFRTGLLSSADAGDIGFHVGALHETIGDPARRELDRAGVRVLLGWRAEQLQRGISGLEVHGRSGRPGAEPGGEGDGEPAVPAGAIDALAADAVILALPHTRAAGLLEPLLGERARRLLGLGTSPIVNLHVLYDRPVLEEPFAAGVGTPVQYLFDRTAAAGAPPGTQYLAVSLSGADREMAMSIEALRELYAPAIAQLLPAARGAKLEYFAATREHAATFRAAPGVTALRPGADTPVAGLYLAGAWTATGWPATLEGAVLSGHAAARAALAALELGSPEGGSTPGRRRPNAEASPAAAV